MAILRKFPGTLTNGSNADAYHDHTLASVSLDHKPSAPMGHLWIPGFLQTPISTAEIDRYAFLQNQDDPTKGTRLQFAKKTNIWALNDIYEGTLVPAWYAAFTPDATNKETFSTTSGWNYWALAADEYLDWDVPADAPAGMDTIVVYYYQVTSGGATGTLKTTTDADWGDANEVTEDTIDTSGVSDLRGAIQTITLESALTPGTSKIRIISPGSTVRLHGILCYDADGICAEGDQRWLVSGASIHNVSSSMEFAYRVGPDGEATKWIGGATYQEGPAYCSQTSPTETVSIDGGAYAAIATGYYQGAPVAWKRVSTAYYDVSNDDIGTITEIYEFDGTHLTVSHSYVVNAISDFSTRYQAMLPSHVDANYLFNDRQQTFTLADVASDGKVVLPTGGLKVSVWYTANGLVHEDMELLSSSETITEHFIVCLANRRKTYWQIATAPNAPVGTTITGSWRLSYGWGVSLWSPTWADALLENLLLYGAQVPAPLSISCVDGDDSDTATATIQLLDPLGAALADSQLVTVWSSATAGGVPAAPGTSMVVDAGGAKGLLVKEDTANALLRILSNAAGLIEIDIANGSVTASDLYINAALNGVVVSAEVVITAA